MSIVEDNQNSQRIARETIEQLRRLTETDGPITDKIKRELSKAEERILKQIEPVVRKVEDQDSAITFVKRLLGNLTKKQKG